jgi:hypothetical protein
MLKISRMEMIDSDDNDYSDDNDDDDDNDDNDGDQSNRNVNSTQDNNSNSVALQGQGNLDAERLLEEVRLKPSNPVTNWGAYSCTGSGLSPKNGSHILAAAARNITSNIITKPNGPNCQGNCMRSSRVQKKSHQIRHYRADK